MITHVPSAGPRMRLMAMAGRVIAFVYPLTGRASYTPAMLASPSPRPDGNAPPHPLELALRADLAAQIKAAPPHSQRKAELTARARALTCQILSRGRFSDAG